MCGVRTAPILTVRCKSRPAREWPFGRYGAAAAPQPYGLLQPGLGQEHHELFAAIPAGHVSLTHPPLQIGGQGLQHQVSLGVPQGIVDNLKIVQVQKKHG
ncbi:MAG: hypothetical protein ABSA09_09980 [Desulfobaccales bacterium]|jgi:hypothetical protein